ncbi:hypothetical protein ACWGMA_26465 [Streptomyces asiaticus]
MVQRRRAQHPRRGRRPLRGSGAAHGGGPRRSGRAGVRRRGCHRGARICELVGAGNGNPHNLDSFRRPRCWTWHGQALAILRPARTPGRVTLTATAQGLESATPRPPVTAADRRPWRGETPPPAAVGSRQP